MTATVRPGLTAFFFISTVVAFARAQEPPIMKTVRALYNNKTTVETSFHLNIFWKVREKEEASSGRMLFAAEGKFRVELGHTTWVSDGETYWQSDRDEKGVQVVIKRLSDADIAMHPSQLLRTYFQGRRYALKEEKTGVCVAEWAADSPAKQSDAAVIRLSIDTKSGIIKTLFVMDTDGNERTFQFTKTKFPAKAPKGAFDFAIPKGASVVDMRN